MKNATYTVSAFVLGVVATLALYSARPVPAAAAGSQPHIEIDTPNDQIIVWINGQDVMRITASGAFVKGDLVYTGALIDTGSEPPRRKNALE